MTMKRNDMQRMIIEGVRRLLCGGQPAQEAMGAGSTDHLTGVNRSLEPVQTAFSSGTDGRSSGKKRRFFRQRTAVLSAQNARSLGRKFLFPREEIFVPSGGNNIFLGRKPFFPRLDMNCSFPHLAIRTLLVIAMILGGVLESGAQTTVNSLDVLKSALNSGGSIVLGKDIGTGGETLEVTKEVTLDLGNFTLMNDQGRWATKDATVLHVKGGTLTLKGSGKIYATAGTHTAIGIKISGTGNVIMEGGTVYAGVTTGEAKAIEISGGSLTVNGGTIEGKATFGGKARGLVITNSPTIHLKGGTYKASPSGYEHAQAIVSGSELLPYLEVGYGYYKGGNLQNPSKELANYGDITVSISPITYTVTYDSKGGSFVSAGSYSISSKLSSLPTPTRTGYEFAGWHYDKGLTQHVSLPMPETTQAYPTNTNQITFYAKWLTVPYTIHFDSQGGNKLPDVGVTVETPAFSLNDAAYKPTRNYYDFAGWYDNGSEVTEIKQTTSDRTLYAKWTKKTYTISYDLNGGTPQINGYYPTSYKVDDDYTISSVVRGDDKFGGWKDTSTGEMLVNNKVPSAAPRNLSLIAVWDIAYKITFNTGTSEVTAPGEIKTNVSIPVTLPTLTRNHYTLTGWKDPNNVVYEPNASYQGDKDVTLTAVWTPDPYTLTFNSQDGSPIASETVTIETSNLSLTDERHIPYRAYYDFKGWYADASCTGNPITSISNATGDQTLYAKWEAHSYRITYEGNDWTKVEGGNYPESYTVESGPVTIGKAKRNKDQFLYWIDTHTNSKLENEELPTDAPRDLSLKAVWNNHYTLSFNTKDQNVTVSDIGIFASETKTLPSAERNGYIFKGWQLGEYTYQAGDSYQATANVTFEAVWEVNPYTIKFIDNGEEVVALQQTYTIESPDVTFFSPSKDYWLFDGWKDENGTIINKIPAGSTGNRVLTASWTAITYVLTYDYGYDNKKETERYTHADRGTADDLKEASRNGYRFLGWFANGATDRLTMRPVDKSVKAATVPITITAHWELQTYPVTFYLNDGTNAALSEQTYRYSVEAGIPAAQMPGKNEAKRTGYTFASWNTKEDGTGTTVTEVSAGTEELKFYAQWEPNSYDITYNWNGGEILSAAPKSFVYNVGVTLPKKEEMHKDHYEFAGWTREESSTNYVTQIEASQYAEEQTFYAQWTPATYTIQFNTNTETTVADLNYLYGSEVALKKSYRNGYTFGGWYFDSALTNPVGDKVTSETIKDYSPRAITFYAKWNPIQYKITYDIYGGKILSGKVDSYRTGEEVMLPMDVKRDGFSFAGWYADDLLTKLVTKIEAGDYGDKNFYATWSRGFSVILSQPKEGVISVKQGDQVIASGTPLAKGTELTISATPTTSGYVLKQLVINGQAFTTSPQKVTMGEANLIISAEFVASTKPTVSAPTITTDPDREKVDAETLVKVTLAKTDAASTLYYSLNTQEERPYSVPFVVDGGVGDTVTIRAIARRSGYTDGIATRKIVFDGRLHLTFDLPAGVTATAPDGGAVVDAIVKGGTFEFKLQVDKSYFASTDSLQVMANDSLIKPGSSGVYRLYDQKGDVKVVVKGLKAHTCVVTLLQTEHGQIAFAEGDEESSRTINYGTELTLQATADEDYKFSKWSTGSQQNPLKLTVVSDTTLSATFVNDYKAYQITLPEVEGVTAKPFTGYSTEVKRDGTFKFYLVIANGYHEEQLVVRADGEELVKNKGGYALYHITKNIRISVEGIARDAFALTLPPNVQAWKLATMEEAAKASLFAETTLLLQAMAPEGQRFLKWTDGSMENPRTATALDAKQLYPLFTTLSEIPTAKVSLEQTAGAGITGATSNLDVANLGDQLSVKVVVLPAYSQSEVRLLANGQSVEPQARLRAASEAKSYYYQVPVAQADVKLKVEGLRLNQYQLTVAESTGGRVEGVPSGKVTHGDTVSLTAKAAEGMTFVRWWDGNTLNPYPYPVTGDQTIRAYFVGESSPVDNESVTAEEVRVCSPTTGGLWVELPVPQDIWLWDSSGRLLLHRFESGTVRLTVPAGIYLLQCGMQPAFKVVVR